MKPLILILLAAVCVQAQTIADAARRERARQAQVKTNKIFTSEDIKGIGAKLPTVPVENPASSAAGASATKPDTAPTAATPAVDPVQQWTEETAKLRNHVRDLQDQETATQLEINSASSQINAPITTQGAKDQANRTLEAAQQKLVQIRSELSQAQSQLQEKDRQGPPVKK